MATRPTVLLVDDDEWVLETLRRSLEGEAYRTLTAPSAEEALKVLSSEQVDVIMSDEDMPGMKGSELLVIVHKKYPETVRLILTGRATLDAAVLAINEGRIFRFLEKPCSPVQVRSFIAEALEEKVSLEASTKLMEAARVQVERLNSVHHPSVEPPGVPDESFLSLSKREREVAELVARGQRIPQIAEQLFISPHTVRNHLKSIYSKLSVHSMVELASKIRGWI